MKLNQYLKMRRIELGISQVDLAKMIGMNTPQQVCNYEIETNPIPEKFYKAIIEALKISKKDFKMLMLSDYEDYINKVLK